MRIWKALLWLEFVLVADDEFKVSYGSQHERSTQSTPRSLRNSEVKQLYLCLHAVRTLKKSWFSEGANCHSFGRMMLSIIAAAAASGAPTLDFYFILRNSPVHQYSNISSTSTLSPFYSFYSFLFPEYDPILGTTQYTHNVRRLPTRLAL